MTIHPIHKPLTHYLLPERVAVCPDCGGRLTVHIYQVTNEPRIGFSCSSDKNTSHGYFKDHWIPTTDKIRAFLAGDEPLELDGRYVL